jgi:predicted nucleotidyltransferase
MSQAATKEAEVALAIIDQSVRRVVEAADPVKVILFGSRVRGDARGDSDIDLLVVERAVRDTAQESARLRRAIGPVGVGVDVVVVDEAGFDKWSEAPGSTLYWAKREGRVLYPAGYRAAPAYAADALAHEETLILEGPVKP